MRVALLFDIHSNLLALKAVLDRIETEGIKRFCVMGDLVGYGPDPKDVIGLVRSKNCLCVQGNHDAAVVGRLKTTNFNPYAAEAVRWTREQLQPEEEGYLDSLPEQLERDEFQMVHGSLRDPLREYVFLETTAKETLIRQRQSICFNGHTHQPVIFRLNTSTGRVERKELRDGMSFVFEEGFRYLVNVGSVGQPRDGDARAAHAVWSKEEPHSFLEFHRTRYDVKAVQKRVRKAGLPEYLAERLALGK